MASFCSKCGKEIADGAVCSCSTEQSVGKATPQGTSNAPLILGIVGAVLMLPGLMCAVICSGFADYGAASMGSSTNYTLFGFIFGVAPIVTGIIGGLKGKTNPKLSFILLLVSAACALTGWYYTAFSSIFHLSALICFIVGAILAKVQKME